METLGPVHHLHPNSVNLNFCGRYLQLPFLCINEFQSFWTKKKIKKCQDLKLNIWLGIFGFLFSVHLIMNLCPHSTEFSGWLE